MDDNARPIRVILANDAELIIEGLKGLLAPFADRVEVIGTATGDPEILHEALVEQRADVMLLDAFGRSGVGLEAARMVLDTDPEFGVAIFTEADDLQHLFAALRLGVRGYLLKSVPTEELVAGLERVAAGETVVDSRLATSAALVAARSTARMSWSGAHLGLSRREAEVLRAFAHGGSIGDVGASLGIGRETVRTHMQQVYRKLGVNHRSAAVVVAWREGLVD